MAKQIGTIKFVGRIGDVVGRQLPNGEVILQTYPKRIRNQHFPEQEANRQRMSLATALATHLGSVMDEAKPICGFDSYAHNHIVGRIKRWMDSLNSVSIFPAELPLVANPDVEVQFISFAMNRESAKVTLHIELIPGQTERLFRCACAIVAYNRTHNQWQSISPMLYKITDIHLDLPDQWEGDELHIAGFILPSFYSGDNNESPLVWGQVCCTLLDIRQ